MEVLIDKSGKPITGWRAKIRPLFHALPKLVKNVFRTVLPGFFPVPLHKQIPLAVPNSLHIDPVNLCNFRCTFCPTGDFELLRSVNRPKGTMPFPLFKKIIDDTAEVVRKTNTKIAEIHLYKDGEPLIHPQFLEMVQYAKEKNITDSLETTTNAALLTPEIARGIVSSGLDLIRISVEHVTSEGYRKITQNYSDYESIKNNVQTLHAEKLRQDSRLQIHTKIIKTLINDAEREAFVRDFGEYSDMLSFNSLMGWSLSEAKDFTLGKDVSTGMGGEDQLQERLVCPEPFRALAVNFDGSVSVCCVDWSFGTIVGNLQTESFSEVWNGDKLRSFRMTHLEGKRKTIPACAACHYLLGFSEYVDLDDRRNEILDRLVK